MCTDRALGSLIGLAVGDALGDLGRDNEYRNRYGIVTNLYANASSTDDTEFALLTTRTLIDCGGDLTVDAQLTAWQKDTVDQGGVFERGGGALCEAVANR